MFSYHHSGLALLHAVEAARDAPHRPGEVWHPAQHSQQRSQGIQLIILPLFQVIYLISFRT